MKIHLKISPILQQYYQLAPDGKALDLACGDGQNSIFLAQSGFEVTGLDGSAENIEKAHKLAARKSLAIDFQTLDPRHFKFHRNRYALIVSDHCFDHLSKADMRELAPKISGSLRKGGLLIGAGLTIDDLSCRELLRKRAELIEKYCFRLPNGWIYSYFDYREPLDLFPDLRVLHYSENNLCETSGGRSAWRSIVEFAFRKS